MNWAAIDLIRNTRHLSFLKQAGAEDWMQDAASIGAALNVVFWGHLHASCQALISLVIPGPGKRQRCLTIVAGLVIPAISCTIAIIDLDIFGHQIGQQSAQKAIPAVYYDGMVIHELNMSPVTTWGVGYLALITLMLLVLAWMTLVPEPARDYIEDKLSFWSGNLITVYLWSSVIVGCILILVAILTEKSWVLLFLLPFTPTLLVFLAGVLPTSWVMIGPGVIDYVWKAYVTRQASISKSCFFMPCAPQSIAENDQAYALLAGLFSFIVPEIALPFLQRVRARRRERAQFLQETERRIELGRVARTGQDGGSSAQNARINSGIAVEEGRAGVGLSRRVRSDLAAQAQADNLVNS